MKTLPQLIDKLRNLTFDNEIIVVDDGSTDGTADYLKTVNYPNFKFVVNSKNMGKGYSFRLGLAEADGDIIATQDADMEYDPKDLYRLLPPFDEGASVVYGSRILNHGNTMSYLRYYLGGRFVTFVTNLLYQSNLSDEPTGYKLFKRAVIESLHLESIGFEFCPEVTSKILRKKINIVEIPISYSPRSFKEGKKINWKDGVKAILTLIKYRFSKLY